MFNAEKGSIENALNLLKAIEERYHAIKAGRSGVWSYEEYEELMDAIPEVLKQAEAEGRIRSALGQLEFTDRRAS